jgi:hypothetical protein
MIMKRTILCVALVSLFALSLTGAFFSPSKAETPGAPPPAPCSVSSVVTDNVNWLRQTPKGGTNIVRVSAVSDQPNRVASYAEGQVAIVASPFPPAAGKPFPTKGYSLGGTLTQYFSDRKFGLNSGPGLSLAQYPFAPQKTDQLGIMIADTGAITLTLISWSGTNINLTGVSCAGGVLYGLTNTNPTQSFYVISLTREFQANPTNPK